MEAEPTKIVKEILTVIDVELSQYDSELFSDARARRALVNVRAQIFNNYAANEMLPEVEDE